MLHLLITIYLLAKRQIGNLFAFFITSVSLFMLFFKPDTYDLINYTKAVNYTSYFTFEPLFSIILITLRKIFSPRMVIWIVQIIILVMTYFITKVVLSEEKFDYRSKIQYFPLILLMPGFILGFSNALRQSIAALIGILFAYNFTQKKRIFSFLFVAMGVLFHFSLIFLVPLLILAQELSKYHVSGIPTHPGVRVKPSYTLVFLFLLLAFLPLFLWMPSVSSFFLSTKYGFYFRSLFIEGRKPLFLKILYGAFSYFGSMIFAKFRFNSSEEITHNKDNEFFIVLNNLRFILLLTSALFIPNPFWWEAGSRILYYYYVVEMFWMLKAFNKGYFYSPMWVFFVNTFAINVWNVLGI